MAGARASEARLWVLLRAHLRRAASNVMSSSPRARWAPVFGLRCWALTAAVLLPGCLARDDSGGTWSLASAREVLSVTREPATPPPLVHVELELSEHAVEYFVALGLRLVVSSGQVLEGQRMLLAWSGDEGGEPAREL